MRTVLSMEPWETINLTSNRFSRFPRGLEDIRSVKVKLDHAKRTAFVLSLGFSVQTHTRLHPPLLNPLPLLQTILLNWNRFSAFPLGVLDLSHLVHLEIGFNQLTEIPPDIGRYGCGCGCGCAHFWAPSFAIHGNTENKVDPYMLFFFFLFLFHLSVLSLCLILFRSSPCQGG